MRVMLRILIVVGLIGLAYFVFSTEKKNTNAKFAADPVATTPENNAQEIQTELNKDYCKKKVVSRFAVVEGLYGLEAKDISLTLLEYSYHRLNNSNRRQAFVTVRCNIDISRFENEAELLRSQHKASGRRDRINVQLPDKERTIIGLIDDSKEEFVTFGSFPKAVKPVVKFAELRKNKPEFLIISLEQDGNCTDCEQFNELNTAVMGFDEKNKTYYELMKVKTYRRVEASDDLSSGTGYIDRSTVSWGDWKRDEYRELIVSTDREILAAEKETKDAFKNKKEIYEWVNEKELVLVEQIVDGKSTMDRKKIQESALPDVVLKDGELYKVDGKGAGEKVTSTDGKINGFFLSPDKCYIAYSMIVGYTDDAGLYDDEEKIPQVPFYHIVVLDLERNKPLTVIKPPSEHEQFLYVKRWRSNDELILYDADGIAAGRHNFYTVSSNQLRINDLGDLEEMSR